MPSFQCQVCSVNLTQLEDALQHVVKHEFYLRRCVIQGCPYTKPRSLFRHASKSHPSFCKYKCLSCPRHFVCHSHLSQHSTSKHGGIVSTGSSTRSSTGYRTTGFTGSSTMDLEWAKLRNIDQAFNMFSIRTGFDFDHSTTAEELNRFIACKLQPDVIFNVMMNDTVDKVCRFFQNSMSPREIIKGGSLGKGTAVKGKADIDLVVILNQITSAKQLQEELPRINGRIIEDLNKDQNRSFTVNEGSTKQTTYSVQFSVQCGTECIKVDLLPTFYFEDKNELYREMKRGPREVEPFYSAALVKLQVKFVSPIPANVKNLIRLVKYWRKEYINETSSSIRLPNSYVLELIVIYLWKRKHKPDRFDTVKAFKSVMETLANAESLDVIWKNHMMDWNVNYEEDIIPSYICHQRPLVMDPANPLNNVCSTFRWENVESKAKEALSSTMLRNVSSISWA